MATMTLNIGANPVVRGALRFTGDTDIGHNITMDLPLVQFGPGAALNLIGDEYGVIEITGEVLADDVTGSFGTITHPDDTLVSPTVLAYLVGMGTLEWQQEGATGFNPLGNCNSFTYEQTVERLDHWQHMTGIRSKDFSPIVQQSATVTMQLDEWTAANLRMYFLDAATVP
jgi:hypothetical protein